MCFCSVIVEVIQATNFILYLYGPSHETCITAGLPSFKNRLECDYPRSTTERSEGPTERSEGVC